MGTTIKQDGYLPVSFIADHDLTAKQYYGCYLTASADGYVQLATGSSGPVCFGVIQTDSGSADAVVEVKVFGFTKVYANAASAITAGERLSVNSQGIFHSKPTDAIGGGSGGNTVAIALDALASGTGYIGAWFFGGIAPCGGGFAS